MKPFKKIVLPLFPLFLSVMASCTHEEDSCLPDTNNEKLSLSFDLADSGVSVETPSTRILNAIATEELEVGTLFAVRAYNYDDNGNWVGYVDKGIYKIVADASTSAKITGTKAEPLDESNALRLPRGTYDLHFLSYNSTVAGGYPDASSEAITVPYGKDLIYTSLKKTVIRADRDGQTEATVALSGYPFEHLCTRVKAVFQIPDGQLVTPTSVSDLEIKMMNLSADAACNWPTGALTPGERKEENMMSLITNGAINSISGTVDANGILAEYPQTADEKEKAFYVLPVSDETTPLYFYIYAKIGYNSTRTDTQGTPKTGELKIEKLELGKALLPGKSYRFIFTLNFYGDYLPADLMLDVQEYTPVGLNPGDVGGDD